MLRKFRTVIFAILTVTLMGSSLALASTPKESAKRSFSVEGRVSAIDLKERTMLIKDTKSGKEYLVVVPESANFKITFGKDSRLSLPELGNVAVGNIVRCVVRLAEDGDASLAKRPTKVTAGKS